MEEYFQWELEEYFLGTNLAKDTYFKLFLINLIKSQTDPVKADHKLF